METYTVRVTKDYLVFCAAHFISYERTQCERLHGHNYRVEARVTAPLDENALVLDFIELKRILRLLTNELDHQVILPRNNDLLAIEESEDSVAVRFGEQKTWIFPREDCVLLDLSNTTAELLASHLTGRLQGELEELGFPRPESLSVEVEETPGQSAIFERRFEN